MNLWGNSHLDIADWKESGWHDIITALLDLRRRKLIGPIIADSGRIYISTSEIDPRGEQHMNLYTKERLIELIASHARKQPATATEPTTQASPAPASTTQLEKIA